MRGISQYTPVFGISVVQQHFAGLYNLEHIENLHISGVNLHEFRSQQRPQSMRIFYQVHHDNILPQQYLDGVTFSSFVKSAAIVTSKPKAIET